jgi:hypothetical protein
MKSIRGMRISADDIKCLQDIGLFGMLSSVDVRRCYAGYKENSVHKRLRLLAENGLVCVAKIRVAFDRSGDADKGGRLPSLYSLTPAGADFVESVTGERPIRVLNSDLAPSTYLHRHEISEAVQIVTRSCAEANLPMPQWVLEQDMWKDAPAQLPPNQRRCLYHAMTVGTRRLICQPDIACLLQLPSSPVVLYWEIDRSTEGRKQLREPAKSDAYISLMATHGFQRYWPDVSIQTYQYVIWVCPTPERLESLRQVFKDHIVAKHMRLSHRGLFNAETNVVTAPIWQTIDGEWRSIYRQLTASPPANRDDERPVTD